MNLFVLIMIQKFKKLLNFQNEIWLIFAFLIESIFQAKTQIFSILNKDINLTIIK